MRFITNDFYQYELIMEFHSFFFSFVCIYYIYYIYIYIYYVFSKTQIWLFTRLDGFVALFNVLTTPNCQTSSIITDI